MAATSKVKTLSQSFKVRLEQLGCPYVEGVDESWIGELIFRPGEQRIRLLQWVFSKLDSSVHDLLDPQYASVDTKMDSRIQRLLFVASSLGLCKPDDAELIRGTTTSTKQTNFIDQLLDIVCIIDAADDPHAQGLNSPGVVSGAMSIDEQFANDCSLIDNLVRQMPLDTLYVGHPKLLPIDIAKQIERNREDKGYTLKDKVLVPDSSKLSGMADQLSEDLQHQNEILSQLMKNYDFPEEDQMTESKINRTLKLVLSELSQLVLGFSYCFENEMRAWCNKRQPQLTDLGSAFKRVHNMLQQFTALLTAFAAIRKSYSHLTDNLQNDLTKMTSKQKSTLSSMSLAAGIGQAALDSFQDCIEVLEESVLRQENMNSPDQTAATFNASVVSVQDEL